MILKNEKKENLLMGVETGAVFGLITGLCRVLATGSISLGLSYGLVGGVMFGVLFTFVSSLMTSKFEKNLKNLRDEMSKQKKIICEGPANHKNGLNAIGGWLFFNEDTLDFYPHKANLGGSKFSVSTSDIEGVDTKANQLIIQTKTEEFHFVVSKAPLWKNFISQIL